MRKKLLFMEDLLQFFLTNNLTKFSSADSGYKLSVQIPAKFEVEDSVDEDHRGMMRLKFRIFHLDLNRNGSFVSEDAAKDAMPTIKDRPVMAYIHQLDNGDWDFETHNMTLKEDEDGNEFVEYEERQVGSFSQEEPFFEYDEELDKTFVCAYAYISEEYTKACDIIRRKGGTKNSVELVIEELAFNAKEKYLDLKKFYVSASTLLGSYSDGREVSEGMIGSRADIVDFSMQNNSVLSNDELINSIADAVVQRLSNNAEFSAKKIKEGGKDLNKFEELLNKYNKTLEDITFEYENLSDEELEIAFKDTFEGEVSENDEAESEAEGDNNTPSENEEISNESENEEEFADDSLNDEANSEEVEENSENYNEDSSKKYSVNCGDKTYTFSVSISEILSAMSELVNATYSESDNDWYMVDVYPDEKSVVFVGCWTGKAYKQNYKVRNDVYSLVSDRVPVKARYVTADEEVELDKMRSNYSAIESKLAKYESEPEKIAIFDSADYASICNSDEFIALREEKNHFDLSVDEVKNKLDEMLLSYAKSGKLEFAADDEKKYPNTKKLFGGNKNKKPSRYGNLFANK